MQRRYFFVTAAGAAIRAVGASQPVKITRISWAPIDGRFHRFVAMNSYDAAPKGHTYSNTLIRIATDQKIEGVGVLEYAPPDEAFQRSVRELVGANPLEVYEIKEGRITGRSPRFAPLLSKYQHLDGPLF